MLAVSQATLGLAWLYSNHKQHSSSIGLIALLDWLTSEWADQKLLGYMTLVPRLLFATRYLSAARTWHHRLCSVLQQGQQQQQQLL